MTDSQNIPKPVVLCILDGWGERSESDNNAIALATTPNWDRFYQTLPRTRLQASGLNVGLPEGQMGNSEVGHTNLGAGRVVMQNLPRIDATLADGSLACKGAPLGGWYACAFGPSTLKSCHGYCVDLLECSTSDILFEMDFVWTIFDWQNFVYVHKQ